MAARKLWRKPSKTPRGLGGHSGYHFAQGKAVWAPGDPRNDEDQRDDPHYEYVADGLRLHHGAILWREEGQEGQEALADSMLFLFSLSR